MSKKTRQLHGQKRRVPVAYASAPTKQGKLHRAHPRKPPPGPDALAAAWAPPGERKSQSPPPVPRAVRKDRRQLDLLADKDSTSEATP
jgi:hypothetical protein